MIDPSERVFYAWSVDAAQYTAVACKSALDRERGTPFEWSLNPYWRCHLGGSDCYARRHQAWRGLTPAEFDGQTLLKANSVSVLQPRSQQPNCKRHVVALGTAPGPTGAWEHRRRCQSQGSAG